MAPFDKHFVIILLEVVCLPIGIWVLIKIDIPKSNRGKVFVMYAGSLIKTFKSTPGSSFQKETRYGYRGEDKVSLQITNMVIDRHRRPDIFISAGTIPILKLISHNISLAHWLLKFASAEIDIAYTPHSSFFYEPQKASEVQLPWYEVLSNDFLRFGRTDPQLDQKGYYMIITVILANFYYNDQKIKDRILGEDQKSEQIFPQETLKTALESGQLQSVASYKHEAVAQGLPYIMLPQEKNLSNVRFSNLYGQGSYTLRSGQTIYGELIFFSHTILETSINIDRSIAFVKYLLSENGQQLFKNNGLNPIKARIEGDFEKIPSVINRFCWR